MKKQKSLYDYMKIHTTIFISLHITITGKEIRLANRKLPTQETLRPDGYTGGFYQTFKEELLSFLHKHFQKLEREETLPNLL